MPDSKSDNGPNNINSNQLVELATILSQQNEFHEILRVVSQKTSCLLRAEMALILMLNPRTHETIKTIHKEGIEVTQRQYRSVQNQISGWIMINKKPLVSPDIKQDARFRKVNFGDVAIKSVLGVPLIVEGVFIGSIILLNKDQMSKFTGEDLTYLEKIAIIAAPYLRNVQEIQHYFQTPLPEPTLLKKYQDMGLLGKSKLFITMLQAIEAAARCDVRVLLEGRSGTGKELVAKAIHQLSQRSSGPFVAVDCGAIPENLVESELFGHVKGAFTGATADQRGFIEEANHGTFFMDEIANLPTDTQAKLLRVLQENEVRPVGSRKSRKVDVRIIAAGSTSLKKLVDEQKFRDDLFYRLHVYPIYIPSLNDRRDDIPMLAHHFLKKYSRQQEKQIAAFDESILHFLKHRIWQGNIRELENLVERLITLTPLETNIVNQHIFPEDIRKEFKKMKIEEKYDYDIPKSLTESLEEYEVQLIRKALIQHNWNQSQAARQLKIPVQTISYKIKKLGITKN